MLWGIRDAIHGEKVQDVVWAVEKVELSLHSTLGIFMGNQPNGEALTVLGKSSSVELLKWAQLLGFIIFSYSGHSTPRSIMEEPEIHS